MATSDATTAAPRPLLRVEGLVAGYGDLDVLKGATVEVGYKETVAVIGPNGAGKSTLMKAAFGLLAPRLGRVLLEGRDVTERPPHERVVLGMAYVPQLDNVFPSLTVEENLELGAWLRHQDTQRWMERVVRLFPVLERRRADKVARLSGGQRQMVALARALMMEPKLLLLDEPSAGLAPNLVADVFDLVRTVKEETGVSVLLVEQNARKALKLCDRAYVLEQGRNRFEGTGQALLDNPDVGRLYLGG